MENTLLTVMISGFTVTLALTSCIWKALNSRIDRMDTELKAKMYKMDAEIQYKIDRTDRELNARMDRIDTRIDRLEIKIDRLEDQLNEIFRFLCRIEGSLSSKDCCVLKHDDKNKKAQ